MTFNRNENNENCEKGIVSVSYLLFILGLERKSSGI
jgi:hypothetical protein